MEFSLKEVKEAYLFLKSDSYHENLNLFLKQRVAKFETGQLDKRLSIIVDELNSHKNTNLNKWLKKIDYHLLPKVVQRKEDQLQKEHNDTSGLFISNVRVSDTYQVSKVNYFVNAPVEIHIIEVLWCLYAGPSLEASMTNDSYGNRMDSSAMSYAQDKNHNTGQQVFKRYIDQYNMWRDQAISAATELSDQGDDVALLSLDLKSFFYNVDLDFDLVIKEVVNFYKNDSKNREIALRLSKILKLILERYFEVTQPHLQQTHPDCLGKQGLPIGFSSSPIIANWYLSEFDTVIEDKVRPAYYGRYADDLIMVFKKPRIEKNNQLDSFVSRYFSNILLRNSKGSFYSILVNENQLPIQKDKLILQFFDADHSRAGLDVFRQELDERSSAFKFLPSDHIDKDLDRYAYDVLYDGSANKLRSIVGLAENESELAKYLASHITAHRLCKLDKKNTVTPQLSHFFKGQNALQFFRLWERIYQYGIIIKDYGFASSFYDSLVHEIEKVECVDSDNEKFLKNLTDKLRRDLKIFNDLSIAMSAGLLDITPPLSTLNGLIDNHAPFKINKQRLGKIVGYLSDIHTFSWQFRYSNLIRHHLVSWPLANYSNFSGDLTSEHTLTDGTNHQINDEKISHSPRFLHFDEWQLFRINSFLKPSSNFNNWFDESAHEYADQFFGDKLPVSSLSEEPSPDGIIKKSISVGENDQHSSLKLAIANLVVNEEDIESALRKDKSPNLSFARQEKLYEILNSALKEKADMLVMPEVSVPVSWLPFMVAFSRRHQIGLAFGLEHWVIDNVAYNIIIEALPFKVSNRYKSCAVIGRIKNHYAPAELDLLDSLRLIPGNKEIKPSAHYHKISWRNASFATYNCFELSDIRHRTIFKSEIDLLLTCVWNKDTNYYQHILESTVRDLHCYTVQANTSQYGGSCVLRPTKTESKTMIYVKGGENSCVLTTEIDIAGLRHFQFKSKPGKHDQFKHLPPGFDSDSVLTR